MSLPDENGIVKMLMPKSQDAGSSIIPLPLLPGWRGWGAGTQLPHAGAHSSLSLSEDGRMVKAFMKGANRLITCPPGALHGTITEQPGELRVDNLGGHSCAKGMLRIPRLRARINPNTTFWASSLQPHGFNVTLLIVICPSRARGYTACSSQPLAGWPAKSCWFWQRDVQCDRQRLLLSLARCFPEFLLQGNVFILWNSCSLKIKTEHEHKSSVCPLGLLRAIKKTGGTSYILLNYIQHIVLHWQKTVKSFSAQILLSFSPSLGEIKKKKSNKEFPNIFQTPLVTLRAPDPELCWGYPPQLSPFIPTWANKMNNSHSSKTSTFKTMFVIIPK